jgi:hypothetical protein
MRDSERLKTRAVHAAPQQNSKFSGLRAPATTAKSRTPALAGPARRPTLQVEKRGKNGYATDDASRLALALRSFVWSTIPSNRGVLSVRD